MSKHAPLSDSVLENLSLPERIESALESYRRKRGLVPAEVNVLDWGCGRGASVLRLRERGYNAYGVDVDPEPIRHGSLMFTRKGYDPSWLSLLQDDGATTHLDDFFHFSFSNQVFEHVRDLGLVASELERITAPGGAGYHIYPGAKQFVEGHLMMPFIHWLPKNQLRKTLIAFFVHTGRDPAWTELAEKTRRERVDAYFQYSIHKTFYRPHANVRRVFRESGFSTGFGTITHPRVAANPILGPLSRASMTRAAMEYLLLTFKSVELQIEKNGQR